jgi:hypothetical protein
MVTKKALMANDIMGGAKDSGAETGMSYASSLAARPNSGDEKFLQGAKMSTPFSGERTVLYLKEKQKAQAAEEGRGGGKRNTY